MIKISPAIISGLVITIGPAITSVVTNDSVINTDLMIRNPPVIISSPVITIDPEITSGQQ